MTQKKYVSDLIPQSEIEKWLPGDIILIEAGTGVGKTTFCTKSLSAFARKTNDRVLILQNRRLAKEQLRGKKITDQVDLDTKYVDNYEIDCYQKYSDFTSKSEYDNLSDLSKFKYKVLDEAHYFVTDCYFNERTEADFKHITKDASTSILILMTATPDVIFELMKELAEKGGAKVYEYKIGSNYDHVESVELFKSKDRISEILKNTITNGTKTLCFIENIERLIPLYNQFKDNSTFCCAKNNPAFFLVNQEELESVTKNEKLIKPLLLSTSVLDTGFSLNDESIKDIIVSASEIHKVVQLIGRYRSVNSKQKIRIHIENYNNRTFRSQLKGWNVPSGDTTFVKGGLIEWYNRVHELLGNYSLTGSFDIKSLYSKFFIDKIEKNHNWLYYNDECGDLKINTFAYKYLETRVARLRKLIKNEISFKSEVEAALGISISSNKELEKISEENRIEDTLSEVLDIPLIGSDLKKAFFKKLNLKKQMGDGSYVTITKSLEANPLIEEFGFKIVDFVSYNKGIKLPSIKVACI